MNRRPAPTRRAEPIDWGEILFRYGAVIAKLGLLGFIVCLAYYIYAIFGGVLQSPDVDLSGPRGSSAASEGASLPLPSAWRSALL